MFLLIKVRVCGSTIVSDEKEVHGLTSCLNSSEGTPVVVTILSWGRSVSQNMNVDLVIFEIAWLGYSSFGCCQ